MLDNARKDLSLYRLEKAEEDLQDSKALLQIGSYKGSNNRAYYAIYHSIRAIFALDGVEYRKHSGNITFFLRDYVRTGVFPGDVSQTVLNASKIRGSSDYDDFYIASKAETENLVKDAEAFYKAVTDYVCKRIDAEGAKSIIEDSSEMRKSMSNP